MEYLDGEHLTWQTVPEIFRPLKGCALRGHSATFRDLRSHEFSVAEKDWLCNEVLGQNLPHQKANWDRNPLEPLQEVV
jgi:hypothetical protein